MHTITFSEKELAGLINQYQQEYYQALQKVEQLGEMLTKLGASVVKPVTKMTLEIKKEPLAAKVDLKTSKAVTQTIKPVVKVVVPKKAVKVAKPAEKPAQFKPVVSAPAKAKPAATKVNTKKIIVKPAAPSKSKPRGRKSIWDLYILKKLADKRTPMGYQQIIDEAISDHRISKENVQKLNQNMQAQIFKLRKKAKKISTIDIKGRKGKWLVLNTWLDSQKRLKPEFTGK